MSKKYTYSVLAATVFLSLFFSFGFQSKIASAQVSPPSIVLQVSTSITQTSAVIYAYATNSPYNYGANYGLTSSYGSSIIILSGSAGSGAYAGDMYFSGTLSGLSCNTTYHYSMFAINANGTSSPVDATFVTSPCTPPTIITGSSTSITVSSATLSENLTYLGAYPASIITLGFNYGTSTSYGMTNSSTASYGTGVQTKSITGLASCTTYHYQAFATNNSTGYGSDQTFTTTCVPPVVTTGSSTSITLSSATLGGNLTTLGTYSSSAIIGLQYGTTTAYGTTSATSSVSTTGAFTKSITGLTSCTTYHYQAFATNGSTATGTDLTFTTSCPPVVTTGASTATSTSATLNGNLTTLGTASSSTIVGFQYGTTTSYGATSTTFSATSTGAFSQTLSGLSACTTYHYRAFAINGTMTTGTDSTFTTCAPPVVWAGGYSNYGVPIETPVLIDSSGMFLYGSILSLGGYTGGVNVGTQLLTASGTLISQTIYTAAEIAPGGSASGDYTNMGGPVVLGVYTQPYSIPSCGTYQYKAILLDPANPGTIIASSSPVVFSTCSNVSTQNFTQSSGTAGTLKGTLNYTDGTPTAYGVAGSFGSPIIMGTATSSPTSLFNYYAPVTGLSCGTTYTFYAFASSTSGASTGYTENFLPLCIPPAVTTGTSSSITYTSATLGGNLTTVGMESSSTSATVGFQYGTTTAYGATSTTSSMSSTGIFTQSLTGLSLCTAYHYRAFATNVVTATGTDQTFTTSCPTPPIVTTVGVSSINQTSATLTGSITSVGSYSSSASIIGFQYGTSLVYGATTTSAGSFGVGNFSLTPTGLACGTTYHYKAFAVNGNTGFGTDKTFQTSNCIGTNGNVTGYAWGSSPGWISLNCAQGLIGTSTQANVCASSQYSVNVTPNFTTHVGTFSGYGWSPSWGWLSFNPSETTSCGAAATITLPTGTSTSGIASGYAKFLTAPPHPWLSCLNLNGTASGTAYALYYTPTITPYNLSGSYTASSTGILHSGGTSYTTLSFSQANLNLATSTLQLTVNGAASTTLTSAGGSVSLVWTATNMTSAACTASGDWSGSKSSGGGSQTITIDANTGTSTITKTYTIGGCTTIVGTTFPSRSITVTIPPSSSSVVIFKANGAGDTTPLNVTTGDAVTLSWQLQNVTHGSCVGTSSGSFSGWNSTSKSPLISQASVGSTPITYTEVIIATSTRSYTMTCTGIPAKTVNIITNVPVLQPSVTLTVNGGSSLNIPTTGGTATLQWIATNLDDSNCTASSSDGLWSGSKSYLGGSDMITIPSSTTTSRSYTLSGCMGNGAVLPPITVTVTAGNTVTLLADGQSTDHINPGQAVTLSWLVQNISVGGSCVGTSSGSYSGWNTTIKLPSVAVATSATFYEVVGADGSITSNRTYTMQCGSHISTANIITDLSGCSGATCSRSDPYLSLTVNGDTTANIAAAGATSTLVWTTANLASTACMATSSDGLWTGSKSSGGGSDTITIPANTSTSTTLTKTYTMSGCVSSSDGSVLPSQSVTITQVPDTGQIISFSANGVDSATPLTITSGSLVTFSWTIQHVNAGKCSGTSSGNFTGWNSTNKGPSTAVTTAQTFYEYDGSDGSITSTRTYTLSCNGTPSSKTITINVVPPIIDTTCVGSSCTATGTTGTINATKRPWWMEL